MTNRATSDSNGKNLKMLSEQLSDLNQSLDSLLYFLNQQKDELECINESLGQQLGAMLIDAIRQESSKT